MAWDTFMLWDELDMLECRLTEFEQLPCPVTHVVAEALVTHRGDPKPANFAREYARFARWHDRIRYVLVEALPGPAPWNREHQQREHCRAGLDGAAPDDILLHGDVDEIPRMEKLAGAIGGVQRDHQVRALVMSQHLYAADWYHPDLEQALTVVARVADIRRQSFTALRSRMGSFLPVPDAGRHLSWLGGPAANRAKLGVHCHLEMTDGERYWPESGRAYREGRTHGGVWQVPVDDLSDYPAWVRERRCPPSWFRPRDVPGQ